MRLPEEVSYASIISSVINNENEKTKSRSGFRARHHFDMNILFRLLCNRGAPLVFGEAASYKL